MNQFEADGPLLICDLRPEWRTKPYVTFWRPGDAGYAYPLSWAGNYSPSEVLDRISYGYYVAYDGTALIRFPVLRDLVIALSGPPAPRTIDGDAGPVVRNNAPSRRQLRRMAWQPAVAKHQQLRAADAAGERFADRVH